MEALLRWGHLAPTAPDTLPCHPFSEGNDPLLLRQPAAQHQEGGIPHIFFAGNQSQLEAREVRIEGTDNSDNSVLLLSVPRFAQSGGLCAMVNLRTRSVRGLRLDTSWLEETRSDPEDVDQMKDGHVESEIQDLYTKPK